VLEAVVLCRGVGIEPDVRNRYGFARVVTANEGEIRDLLGRTVDVRVRESPQHCIKEDCAADPEATSEPPGRKLGPPCPDQRRPSNPQACRCPGGEAEGDQRNRKNRGKKPKAREGGPESMVAFNCINCCNSE
jgi:hypothetical protein